MRDGHHNPIWAAGEGKTYDRFRKAIGVPIESGYIDMEICLSHDKWIRERGKR